MFDTSSLMFIYSKIYYNNYIFIDVELLLNIPYLILLHWFLYTLKYTIFITTFLMLVYSKMYNMIYFFISYFITLKYSILITSSFKFSYSNFFYNNYYLIDDFLLLNIPYSLPLYQCIFTLNILYSLQLDWCPFTLKYNIFITPSLMSIYAKICHVYYIFIDVYLP